MFKFFLPNWIFGREVADNRQAWSAWAARAQQAGYHGLAIHDRRLTRLPTEEADQFINQCRDLGLEIIFGLDTDFTRSAWKNQAQAPASSLSRLKWAFRQGISTIRVTTGGQ